VFAGLSGAWLPPLRAQWTIASDPVGYVSMPVQANSDTLVSIPFTQPPLYTGPIGTIAGNTITLSNSPGWTPNQFVYAAGVQSNTYYAIIGPNPAALTGTLTMTNGSTAVTGDGTAFTAQVAAGDEFLVNGLAYNVTAILSDTSLTLSDAYTGASATGLTAADDHSPKEGCFYTVTANGTNTLTVDLNGDSLSTVVPGTLVSLIAYWTLGTAFPASLANASFVPPASPGSGSLQTQVLLPDLTDAGINLAPAASYFYYNGAWRQAGQDPTVSYNDVVLPPTAYITVRNAATPTTLLSLGGVYMNRLALAFDTQTSQAQDNAVAVTRPVPIALNDLGLISSGAFLPSSGSSPQTRADSLLTYDNTQTGNNKSASAIYFYYNGAWRLAGADPTVDYGATTIPLGSGFTVRKAQTAGGTTSFGQNTRTY
jgi:uncharacterized protein (TIGR02597 family)